MGSEVSLYNRSKQATHWANFLREALLLLWIYESSTPFKQVPTSCRELAALMASPATNPLPPNVNNGPKILAVAWIECGVALLFVLARMYTRHKLVRKVGWDDWAVVFTMVSFKAYIYSKPLTNVPVLRYLP